jgi:glycosyltransferase involved in cell wall biosynthesis
MKISIVIPTLNEANYLKKLVQNLLKSKNVISEIFICDAGSTDGTIDIIEELKKEDNCVKLINNKKKFVSYAFNEAYNQSTGKYLALLGSHAFYPDKYLENGLKYLESGEADVIGGPLNQQGNGENGNAIALAMSSKFGVGDTEFRTSKKKQYVDSVAFAIYRKEIFEKIGLLNESLKRNQDDELHYRIKANGYKILMVPEMECTYFVRNSFKTLFKQYYGYGLYKPLVLKLVKQGLRIRHLIPAFFVLYLFLIPLIFYIIGLWSLVPLGIYVFLAIYISSSVSKNVMPNLKIVYACLILHISYGSGFLLGISKRNI